MDVNLPEVTEILRCGERTGKQLESLYNHMLRMADLKQYLFDLQEEKRGRLLAAVQLLDVPAGEFIFHKGDSSDLLYTLLSGTIGMYDGHGLHSPMVATLPPGKVFGERGLVRKAPRMLSALALTPCILMTLTAGEFKTILDSAFRLRNDEKIYFIGRNLPGAKNVLSTVKEKIAYSLNMRFCPKGRRLLTQGKHSDTLFFIISGECTVSQVSAGIQHMVVTLGPGSLFGDESVLLGQASSYHVDVTAEGTRVYSLAKTDALQFIPDSVLDNMRRQCTLKFETRHSLLSRSRVHPHSTPQSPEPLFRLASPIAKRKLVFAQRMRPSIQHLTRCETERIESLRLDLCHFTPSGHEDDDERRSKTWRSPRVSILTPLHSNL